MLCLSESAMREGKAGTKDLTRIRRGDGLRRRMFFVRSELNAHIQQLIDSARAPDERVNELVWGVEGSHSKKGSIK